MTLFDPGPPTKRKKVRHDPPLGFLLNSKRGLYQISCGTRVEYVRAYGESDAVEVWAGVRRMEGARDEVRVRAVTMEDLERIEQVDPKLARKLRRLYA